MSRGRRTITKAQAQSVIDKPLLVLSIGIIYVLVNSVIDARARLFSIDQALLYSTIATFAGFIVLSL
jgi:hypothetical protein